MEQQWEKATAKRCWYIGVLVEKYPLPSPFCPEGEEDPPPEVQAAILSKRGWEIESVAWKQRRKARHSDAAREFV